MTEDEFANEFRETLTAAGLSVQQAAVMMTVSRPTITRWMSGEAAPHETMRAYAIKKFKEKCSKLGAACSMQQHGAAVKHE